MTKAKKTNKTKTPKKTEKEAPAEGSPEAEVERLKEGSKKSELDLEASKRVIKANEKNKDLGYVIDPKAINNTEDRFSSNDLAARQPEVTGPEENKPGAAKTGDTVQISVPKVTHQRLREFIKRLKVGPEEDSVVGFITNSGNHVGLDALSDNQLLDAHQRSLGGALFEA